MSAEDAVRGWNAAMDRALVVLKERMDAVTSLSRSTRMSQSVLLREGIEDLLAKYEAALEGSEP